MISYCHTAAATDCRRPRCALSHPSYRISRCRRWTALARGPSSRGRRGRPRSTPHAPQASCSRTTLRGHDRERSGRRTSRKTRPCGRSLSRSRRQSTRWGFLGSRGLPRRPRGGPPLRRRSVPSPPTRRTRGCPHCRPGGESLFVPCWWLVVCHSVLQLELEGSWICH
ncbi:hypothetical protein B484DRAFT_272138 [Ochromonadaceae sp. CCMP2298]|nr:hypothetical protein B484DRAFT_272138 [Ochromonadaceae sp. CCMP2298]